VSHNSGQHRIPAKIQFSGDPPLPENPLIADLKISGQNFSDEQSMGAEHGSGVW